jgi:hypothetical protein
MERLELHKCYLQRLLTSAACELIVEPLTVTVGAVDLMNQL